MISIGLGLSLSKRGATAEAGTSPPFVPSDLSGLMQWSEFGDLSAGAVSSWTDKSGNGNHWVQATGSLQPVKDATGVVFDGTDDAMTCNALATLFDGANEEYTAFVVANPTVGTGTRTLLGGGSSLTTTPTFSFRLNALKAEFTRRGDSNESTNITRIALTAEAQTAQVFSFQHKGRGTSAWANGVLRLDALPQDISAATLNRVSIGALVRATSANFWQGPILATLIYNRALSTTERQQVEAYLGNLYSLSLTTIAELSATRAVDLFYSWWTLPPVTVIGGVTYAGGVSTLGTAFFAKLGSSPTKLPVFDTQDQPDDHSSVSILAPSGKVPLVFWTDHFDGITLNFRRGSVADDLTSLGTVTAASNSGAAVDYAQAFNRTGTNEGVVFYRDATRYWSYRRTTDHYATLATKQTLLDFGVGTQGYMYARQVGADTLRVVAYGHPTIGSDNNIYYCAIDLNSGDVTKRDGTVIGNIKTGTSLPLLTSSLDSVYTHGVGEGVRLFEVGDGTDIEIAFATWTTDTNTAYKYCKWNGSAWAVKSMVAAGASFGYLLSAHYVGGMSFPVGGSGGTVFLARESSGVWTVEKWVTADGGDNWTTTVLATASSGHKYIRPRGMASTDPLPLLFLDCTNYGGDVADGYETYAGDFVGLTSV